MAYKLCATLDREINFCIVLFVCLLAQVRYPLFALYKIQNIFVRINFEWGVGRNQGAAHVSLKLF